jgi:hypothetical protein
VTTYPVANAVSLTARSFLAQPLGGTPFFLIRLALFTASSLLWGYAWNLDWLLLFPHRAGSRRRHGATGTVDPGEFLPARKARPGLLSGG